MHAQPATFTPTATATPAASRIPTDRVQLHCRACARTVPLGPLMSYLSSVKITKCGGSLVRLDAHSGRFRPPAPPSPHEPCLHAFLGYLESLNQNGSLAGQNKAKKIKKRGRKKWVARHDLILEGCILLWGEDISKIMRLLPEFNENVIRRKLGHVLWKNYSLSDAKRPKADEPKRSLPQETTPQKPDGDLMTNLTAAPQVGGPEIEEWDMGADENACESQLVESTISFKKGARDFENLGTALGSEERTGFAFERPMLYRERQSLGSTDLAQLEGDNNRGFNVSRFSFGDAAPNGGSFTDLSRLWSDPAVQPRDCMTIPDMRREQGLYQNSLADIFGFERSLD